MGEHVLPQTPRAMPTAASVTPYLQNLPKPFLVAGSRAAAVKQNRAPDPAVHCEYRFAQGAIDDLADKKVVAFVHGYNVTTDRGLQSARDFFLKLYAALARDGQDPADYQFISFTWPGDTGTVYFNRAQEFAHLSGVALCRLLQDAGSRSLSLVTHSLGAHVALRAASVLGQRRFSGREGPRIDHLLLLAASVEDDVFENPSRADEYHFPESAFGTRQLHISASRSDEVLALPYLVSEADRALGYCGPESMSPLVSLARRVSEVLGPRERFNFELHDFSPRSATILNPELHVLRHGDYWRNAAQLDYYVDLMSRVAPAPPP